MLVTETSVNWKKRDPSKSSGHYMYHQLNIQQFYVYVFCVDIRTNSDYFPKPHEVAGLCTGNGVYWVTDQHIPPTAMTLRASVWHWARWSICKEWDWPLILSLADTLLFYEMTPYWLLVIASSGLNNKRTLLLPLPNGWIAQPFVFLLSVCFTLTFTARPTFTKLDGVISQKTVILETTVARSSKFGFSSVTDIVSVFFELSAFRTHPAYFSHDRNDCGELVVGLGRQGASLNRRQSIKGGKQIAGQRICLCDVWRCHGSDSEAQVSGLWRRVG